MNLESIKNKANEVLSSPETLGNSSKLAALSGWLMIATGIDNTREHGSIKKETALVAAACVGSTAIGVASALSKA